MTSTELKERLISILEEKLLGDTGREYFEHQLEAVIRRNGFLLSKNVRVGDLVVGRKGFINYLVMDKSGAACAIELDNRSPRQRSLQKLQALPVSTGRLVVLRDGKKTHRYQEFGIDVIRATKFK
ncbi:hypothetical protein AH312_09800 [Salmonella enterica subsp. enterica]|nr:hypothetical protein [Salmonella enterica subsp. enterica serovar Soumbedioune]EEC0858714.1 hypothetical protein [Salmonella enterica subsp. enterica serovar Soumbedioune]ELW6057480.1 hypothetical protein [Salmonella enterica]